MNLIRQILFSILFYLLLTNCIGQEIVSSNGSSKTIGPEKGHLVIVGGNLSDSSIYARFLELAGGPDAQIVIIVSAGSDEILFDNGGLESIKKRFSQHNFNNYVILHTRNRDEANSEAFVKPITKASGLWFTGGRQWRLADSYLDTRTHEEIKSLLERGGVVGGSSAGASIMGSYLVRGDTKTNTVMMGDHEQGLSLITNCAIDQHLLALNRQFDILEILKVHPDLLGIGLDENTAIVVHDNQFEVIGESFVAVYDGTFCQFVRDKSDWSLERPEISILPDESQQFYLLSAGRKYSLSHRRVIE